MTIDPRERDRTLPGLDYNKQSPYNVGWYSTVYPEERYMTYILNYYSIAEAIRTDRVDELDDWQLALQVWAAEDFEAIDSGIAMMEQDPETIETHNEIFGPGVSTLPGYEDLGIPKINNGTKEEIAQYQADIGVAMFQNDEQYGSNFELQHPKHSKQLMTYHIVEGLRNELGKVADAGIEGVSSMMGTDDRPDRPEGEGKIMGPGDPSTMQYYNALIEGSHGPTSTSAGLVPVGQQMIRFGVDMALGSAALKMFGLGAREGVAAVKKAGGASKVGHWFASQVTKARGNPRAQGKIAQRALKRPIRNAAWATGLTHGLTVTGYDAYRKYTAPTQFNKATYDALEGLVGEDRMREQMGDRYRTKEEQEIEFSPEQQGRYDEYQARMGL